MRLSAKKTALFLFYFCLLIFAGLQMYGAFAPRDNVKQTMFWDINWNTHHEHIQRNDHHDKIKRMIAMSDRVNALSLKPDPNWNPASAQNGKSGKTNDHNDVPFIPRWKDVEQFRKDVEFLNHNGFVHNEDKFKVTLTDSSIVIFVQVHNRADQLQMQLDSFRQMRYINETIVIFSHDFMSQEIFDVIAKIDFCPYMQIFYPYAIQVYTKEFPGDDPNDCPRNFIPEKDPNRKCNNVNFPDQYGHYREATHAQLKHHWLWKLQFIFENCSRLRKFEGIIFRLDDDYYLAADTLYYLRKLDEQSRKHCPECKMFIMGQSNGYSSDMYESGAAKRDYWWAGNGRGMAFRKEFWEMFKECAKSFCLFDDVNWDWSLMHVTATCIPGGLKILKPLGSRVFHLGSCKGFHKNKACETVDILTNIKGILHYNRNYLFPAYVDIVTPFPERSTLDTPYGGWSDIRDRDMCLRIFQNQSLSTDEFRNINRLLFS